MVVVSSPTLISQRITTCFRLKHLGNPLPQMCLMAVSTSQLFLPFLGETLQFPSSPGGTAWLEPLAWDIVAGQLEMRGPSPRVKRRGGDLEVALEMFSSWQ